MKCLGQVLLFFICISHAFGGQRGGKISSDDFDFTADHLRQLRNAHAVWNPVESGAPAIFFGDELDNRAEHPDRDDIIITFIGNARFKTGRYAVRLIKLFGFNQGMPAEKTIDITDAHLKLLRSMRWENGMVNGKRPYGDLTYFEKDMADILGIALEKDGKLSARDEKYLGELHEQLLFVLQAFLDHADLAPGAYPLSKLGYGTRRER